MIFAMAEALVSIVASIPSPANNQIDLGPIALNLYGLSIGMGVMVGTMWVQRRWAARGGIPDDVVTLVFWGVPAGIIGARMYHNITDGRDFADWHKIWEGGLGIPGGIIAGLSVGILVAKIKGMDIANLLDAIIPGLPVAQAFGRLGNYFNQEVYGGPTDLPWGLEIHPPYRPQEFADQETFHPAFLYEGLWNLGLAFLLVRLDRTGKLRKGMMMPLYIAGYGMGRFLVESIRIDAATRIFDVRVNHWVSGAALIFGLLAAYLVYRKAGPSFYSPDYEGPTGGDRYRLVKDGGPIDAEASDGDSVDVDSVDDADSPDDGGDADSKSADVGSS